jgi:hypothetical protein
MFKLHAGTIRELVGQIRSGQFFSKKFSGKMEGRLPPGITDGTATVPPSGLAQKAKSKVEIRLGQRMGGQPHIFTN